MIGGRPAATIALYHRRRVQPVDHLDDKPREMPLGKPFIERRRKQKPRRAVKLPEIAHQAHPAANQFRHHTRCVRSAKSDRLLAACEEIQGLYGRPAASNCELAALIDGRPVRYTFAKPLPVNSAAENGTFFF